MKLNNYIKKLTDIYKSGNKKTYMVLVILRVPTPERSYMKRTKRRLHGRQTCFI